jgi:hypothetical protein
MIAVCIPRKELGTRAEARNKEVERAIKMNATYILFLDSDQTMPNNALTQMIGECSDIAVVDTPPHNSNASNVKYNTDGTIAYCTIACSLIKTKVFKILPKPWFSSKFDFVVNGERDGKIVFDRLDKSFDNNRGEDIYMIRNAINAGFQVKVVKGTRCSHFNLGDI